MIYKAFNQDTYRQKVFTKTLFWIGYVSSSRRGLNSMFVCF